MGGIEVEIHEPVNVLSTMLLAVTGGPKDAKLHPIAEGALEYVRPFLKHASLAWLGEFFRPPDVAPLYGRVALLSGPVSFVPRAAPPARIESYEPARMKDLPARMAAFYKDAKLGHFRRSYAAPYTLAAADVADAVQGAGIESFLAELYGRIPYRLVVVPVPTHPFAGGGTWAVAGLDDLAFLHPPKVAAESRDPVAWSLDPQGTQVLALHELGHALFAGAAAAVKDLVPRLQPVLAKVPADSAFARRFPAAESQVAELFLRGASAAFLRHSRGDEEALRWLGEQAARLGTNLPRDVSLAIEEYLGRRRWTDLRAFLADLPKILGA